MEKGYVMVIYGGFFKVLDLIWRQVFERVEELIRFRYLRSEVVGIRFEMKCKRGWSSLCRIAWKVFKCRTEFFY